MGRTLPLAGLLLLALFLTACAGPQTRLPTAANWAEHSTRLEGLTSWTAEGKLALRTPEQSESATIQWRQEGNNTHLYLSGPLGVAATTLDSDGQTLEIHRGDQTTSWDISETALLERHTGWDLPLQALPHWLKGLPAPGMDIQSMELGPDPALLHKLQQDDWFIRYEAYDNFGNITLPTQLHMHHNGTTVRVIIRSWQVAPG